MEEAQHAGVTKIILHTKKKKMCENKTSRPTTVSLIGKTISTNKI
jgi:hypothetical protein